MDTPSKLRLLAILMLLGPAVALGASFPLSPTKTLPVGTAPRGVVVFDHNIAVVNSGSNSVSVFLGSCTNSSCTYNKAPGSPLNVGLGPTSIAKGHFRGPGTPWDLVTSNYADPANTVTVLLGSGAGRFPQSILMNAGPSPETVVVGSFKGDGYDDIAVTNATGLSPTVSVILNNRDCSSASCIPSFAPAVPYTLPHAVLPWGLATGRFQKPGHIDLVVANYYSSDYGASGASVLRNMNDGSGTFYPAVAYPAGFYSPYVATGHFNSKTQKLDDFAVTNLGGWIFEFNNDNDQSPQSHDGAFATTPAASKAVSGFALLAIATINNGNGSTDDLVVANVSTNQVEVLQSKGGGLFTFPPAETITVSPAGLQPVAVLVDDVGVGIQALLVVNEGTNNLMIFVSPTI